MSNVREETTIEELLALQAERDRLLGLASDLGEGHDDFWPIQRYASGLELDICDTAQTVAASLPPERLGELTALGYQVERDAAGTAISIPGGTLDGHPWP